MDETVEALDPKQLALETSILHFSFGEYRAKVDELKSKEMESLAPPVRRLLGASVGSVADELVKWCEQVRSRPGKRATAYAFVANMRPQVFATLALRETLNSISRPTRIQALAKRIGGEVERELLLEQFEEQQGSLYRTIERRVAESPLKDQPDYRPRVLIQAARKYAVKWTDWDDDARIRVGMLAIDLIEKATGFIETYAREDGIKRVAGWYVGATKDLLTHLDEAHKRQALFLPTTQPMLAPPLDHGQGGKTGGYYLPHLRRQMVKSSVRQANMLNTPEQAPIVYRAVNALQRVEWRVDDEVAKALEATWEHFGEIPGMARRDDAERDPEPVRGTPEWLAWKRKSRDVFLDNRRNRGKRVGVVQTLGLAHKFREKTLWHPYMCDFRGRIYAVPAWLNPQGSDLSKSLMRFARTKPIGDVGYYWLCVHVANCFGYDKESFDDRVAWVEAHRKDIQACAEDSLGYLWWYEADQPCRFLAACIEINKVWKHGLGFETGLPCCFDGSANGLQHLGAMSRDLNVARLVNLIFSGKPSSCYGAVAAATMDLLAAEDDPAWVSTARRWHQWNVDRQGAKRPTMIVPYNGGIFAFVRYLREWHDDRINHQAPRPFDSKKETDRALFYLARVMREAIFEKIKGPAELMKWGTKAVSVVAKQGKPIKWTSPAGFVCVQAYPEVSSRTIKTRLGDKVMQLQLRENGVELDPRKQARAWMPNVTHSYDAAHEQLVICELLDRGIVDMHFNHDEYGTLAPDCPVLREVTPRMFHRIYKEDQRWLLYETLQSQTTEKIPEPPALGELDVDELQRANYMFG